MPKPPPHHQTDSPLFGNPLFADIFDPGSVQPLPGLASLHLCRATLFERPVLAAATQPGLAKGIIGVAECDALEAAIRLAQAEQRTLVLLLDSAGARLTDGLPIQGALRRLVRSLGDAHLEGLQSLALLGRHVFGGASMLAYLTRVRGYHADTLLAMSGPRIIQEHGAHPLETVVEQISGKARSAMNPQDVCFSALADAASTARPASDPTPSTAGGIRAQLQTLLAHLPAGTDANTELETERQRLRQRLAQSGLTPLPGALLQLAQPADRSILRCQNGISAGAAEVFALTEALLACNTPRIEIEMGWNGHSIALADEQALLTQYLTHLTQTLRSLIRQGKHIQLTITAEISGGISIATTAGASRVELGPQGAVRTLPPSALKQIFSNSNDRTRNPDSHGTPDVDINPLTAGVADACQQQEEDNSMNNNIFARFEATATTAGERVFLETETGRQITWAQMLEITARYAHALQGMGVCPGDRVAVQVEKSAENFCLYLATLRMGAIYLPLNTAYKPAELAYFLTDAEPRVYLCTQATYATHQEVAQAHGVAHVLTLETDGSGLFSDAAAGQPSTFASARRSADDVAIIIYTSGTTGKPKGAMLTHANLISNGEALTRLWGFGPDDVLLHALPLFHAHGLFISSHCALFSRSKILLMEKFVAQKALELLPRATVMMGVPTFYTRLLDLPEFNTAACARMRLFISGSAPLLAETGRLFQERTGHTILERYGMTEAAIITSNPYAGERRIGSVGQPIEGVALRIADGDDQPLARGEVGMIQIRGPGVMQGYWRKPEKTAEEFTADGWFRTGDLGILSADGYVDIVGRGKDLVISGGYNVYPKEIEMVIDSLPGVLESAVIGIPDRDFGEAVTAVVVRTGPELREEDIIQPLKQELANYKVPKQVHFVDALPRNAMGKVLKNELRQRYSPDSAPSTAPLRQT